jgi:hypothetical protein
MSSVPYKQGAADRYYGRKHHPRIDNEVREYIEKEYKRGWNEEQDRKDWGDGQFAPQQADMS